MADQELQDFDWEREELVLACDLLAGNRWRYLGPKRRRVIELSELLRRLPLHPAERRRENFRSPNSVARKIRDFLTNRPGYPGTPTNGGEPTKRVMAEFLADPASLHNLAQEIRRAEAQGQFTQLATPIPDEEDGAPEGRLLLRSHVIYERNPSLHKKKIAAALRAGVPLACEVCGFDF